MSMPERGDTKNSPPWEEKRYLSRVGTLMIVVPLTFSDFDRRCDPEKGCDCNDCCDDCADSEECCDSGKCSDIVKCCDCASVATLPSFGLVL